jgi:hypothetical protein
MRVWLVLSLMVNPSSGLAAGSRPNVGLHGSSCYGGSRRSARISRRCVSTLWAQKPGKSTKRHPAAVGGGGFGGASRTHMPPSPTNDYAVFPRLEPPVADTLVAAPEDWEQPGPLPNEIYQRLDQIYGLPRFNYETSEPVSLDKLMVAPKDPPSISRNEFDDLLSAATGRPVSTPPASTFASTPSSADLPLDALPPFEKFRILHVDPLVLGIDDFFTAAECDRYVALATQNQKHNILESRSPTVGKDAAAKAQRTSTTYYNHFEGVPELMAKASRLLGLQSIDRWEEPQTVRYRKNEKFTWHLDALGPNENNPGLGGQRLATLLVYHTDLQSDEGGATMFRDLTGTNGRLAVRPRRGAALLFFPAAGGIPNAPFDVRTLHCGQAVSATSQQDKWISQLWLRQSSYTPTAPPGNSHSQATKAISEYCANLSVK